MSLIVLTTLERFPARDELSTCEAGLVPPKRSVQSILIRSRYALQLTITHCNIIETRPRAAWGTATLELTKQELPRDSMIKYPESMT